jgi:hypothetical protein
MLGEMRQSSFSQIAFLTHVFSSGLAKLVSLAGACNTLTSEQAASFPCCQTPRPVRLSTAMVAPDLVMQEDNTVNRASSQKSGPLQVYQADCHCGWHDTRRTCVVQMRMGKMQADLELVRILLNHPHFEQ